MLGDAIEYPTRGDDALATILIGGFLPMLAAFVGLIGLALSIVVVGLFVLPFAVVPVVFLVGYYVSVLRSASKGEAVPPRFVNWTELFVDGIVAILIGVVYAVPLIALGLLLTLVLAAGTTSPGETLGEVAITGAAVLVGGALVLYGFALAYVVPIAWTRYASEGEASAAFSHGEIRAVALRREYAVAWTLAFVVGLVGNAVARALYLLLVGFFVKFYVEVVTYRLYSRGVALAAGGDATPREAVGPADTDVEEAQSVPVANGFEWAGESVEADPSSERSGPGQDAGSTRTEREPDAPDDRDGDGWPDWDDSG